jgi:hypothetical protein
MSMILVMNRDETSSSWSEWLDLQIKKLKYVHGPIVKEDA